MLEFDTFTLSNSLLCSISINVVLIFSSFCVGDILIEFIQDVSKGFYIIVIFHAVWLVFTVSLILTCAPGWKRTKMFKNICNELLIHLCHCEYKLFLTINQVYLKNCLKIF